MLELRRELDVVVSKIVKPRLMGIINIQGAYDRFVTRAAMHVQCALGVLRVI
jgi:hypothetical protein